MTVASYKWLRDTDGKVVSLDYPTVSVGELIDALLAYPRDMPIMVSVGDCISGLSPDGFSIDDKWASPVLFIDEAGKE